MTTTKMRKSSIFGLVLTVVRAKIDWNLETTFLQHL